jgi:L,D-transpeptidase catalytic domain
VGSLTAAVAVASALIVASLLAVQLASPSHKSPTRRPLRVVPKTLDALPEPVRASLPAPVRSALSVPRPRSLKLSPTLSRWATVIHSVPVLARPALDSPPIARMNLRTPEGTSNAVLVLGTAVDHTGRLWVHVRLPVLPNNSTGWMTRDALGPYTFVRTRLVVDLERLTVSLLLDGRSIFRAPIGVGVPSSPTPTGNFYIRDKLIRYRSPFYGPVAFGTSARSSFLTDWPAGGFIGIHGTDRPDLLPGRVSHGCIRMRNADIQRLSRLLPIGTPLTIR